VLGQLVIGGGLEQESVAVLPRERFKALGDAVSETTTLEALSTYGALPELASLWLLTIFTYALFIPNLACIIRRRRVQRGEECLIDRRESRPMPIELTRVQLLIGVFVVSVLVLVMLGGQSASPALISTWRMPSQPGLQLA